MGKKLLRNYDSNGNLISKECSKCHEIKEVSEFSKDKSRNDGMQSICKECDNKKNAEYYKQNKDKIAEYYQQNKDKIAEQRAEHYQQNKDKIKEQRSEYYQQNKDKINKRKTEYRKQNLDKIREYQSEYRKQNKDKIKEQRSEYRKQNIDKIKGYQAKWRKQNADKLKEQRSEYYQQNKDKIAEHGAEYRKQKVKQALVEIKIYIEKDPQRYNYNPNKEIYGIIYLVHNVKSDKYYVGQTIRSFDLRYNNGWLYAHNFKDTVKEDLELYGEDSFEYIKIFKVAHSQQELDKLEAYYIDYFNSYDNGYNETRGNIFTERK